MRVDNEKPAKLSSKQKSKLSSSSLLNSSQKVNFTSQPNPSQLSSVLIAGRSQESNGELNKKESESAKRINSYSVTVTECDD